MSYSVEIYEHDHFYKSYEDRRNNLYILYLDDSVEAWCEEHINNYYDMWCEDYYTGRSTAILMEFVNERDAIAFEMEWIFMTIDIEDFKVYEIERGRAISEHEIKWITGLKHSIEINGNDFKEHAQFRDWCLENCSNKVVFVENPVGTNLIITVFCYDENDAMAVKLRWV